MASAQGQPVRVLLGGMTPWQAGTLRDFLASDPTIVVAGVTGDASETLERAAAWTPDVVLLNFHVHGLNGLDAVRQLRHVSPTSRVVMLGDIDSDVYHVAARDAGASAYLPWLSRRKDLLAALHGVGVQLDVERCEAEHPRRASTSSGH